LTGRSCLLCLGRPQQRFIAAPPFLSSLIRLHGCFWRHAAGAEGGLPRLRVRIEPACERAEHAVNLSAGSVRHAFDIMLDQGRVPRGTRLTLVDRDRLKEQAVGPAVVGGRMEFMRVALPRD
jgi:hypothetical protein